MGIKVFRSYAFNMTIHNYATNLLWRGNTGEGYRAYGREHHVELSNGMLPMSADPAFRGDPALPNPEQLLLAAASSCQLLSFLAVAALAKVEVLEYRDNATAVMQDAGVQTQITSIELNVTVITTCPDQARVVELIEEAHEQCYIANSLKTSVLINPTIEVVA